MEPRIQYARTTDGISIAYWTMGQGIPFLELQIPFSNIEREAREWEFHRLVARDRMLIRYDNRGSGSSDRDVTDFSLDALLLDLEAVVDRLGFDRVALYGEAMTSPLAIAYAARNPERVSHLLLVSAYADPNALFGAPRMKTLLSVLEQGDWEAFSDGLALLFFGWDQPSAARDISAFYQSCMTSEACRAFFVAALHHDVTVLLPQVRAATLVLHPRGGAIPTIESARVVAAGIPDATLKVIDSPTAWSDELTEGLLIAFDEFLGDGDRATLAERLRERTSPKKRSLVTILFTDIVGHTEMMRRLGDAQGRGVLREHERITRETLKEHGGAEIKTMGDGFMASFGSVTQAMECAIALQQAFERHSDTSPEPLHVRVGLNAGEPIAEEGDLFGSTVILASRIAAKAQAGEILVSNVARELCSGKGFLFSDRGESVLRGFEDPVRLYEVRWRTLD